MTLRSWCCQTINIFWIWILIRILLCLSACASGSFKPTQGDEACMQCPINSRTTSEGAINCVCRNGYYRTDSDPLQMPCTSMYRTDVVIWTLTCTSHTHTHRKSLWIQIWTFWHIHISHPQADELRDQRTVVVCVTPNRETLSEPSLTRTRRWHAHSVAVHRSDPAHKARLPLLNITQPVLQAGPEVTGPGRVALWRGRPGEWAQARLSLVMPMKLFEFEFEFEADTEVERKRERKRVGRIDQRKGERWGVGVKREGKTRRKEWRREREFEREREGLRVSEKAGEPVHRVWSN